MADNNILEMNNMLDANYSKEYNVKERRISLLDRVSRNDIIVRHTGLEEFDLSVHSHNRHQIIYITSGTLHVEVDDSSYFVTERHLVWIPEGTNHRLSSNNRKVSLIVGYFYAEGLNDDIFSIYMTDETVVRILEYTASYKRINTGKTPDAFSFAMGFFRLLPGMCKKTSFPVCPPVVINDSRLAPVLDYIKANLNQNINIKSVAEHFGFSVRNLTRLFTGSGISFVHYLNYERTVRAIEILSDKEFNIEQTAYEVGFNSLGSFSRVFKQITGESPSDYMK